MWTQNKLFHPQDPKPGKIRPQTRRHNREHIVALGRSISGRTYLVEAMDYTDRNMLADDIAVGQIYDCQAVFAFNPFEGWSRDISEHIAQLILDRHGITRSSRDFLEDQLGVNGG